MNWFLLLATLVGSNENVAQNVCDRVCCTGQFFLQLMSKKIVGQVAAKMALYPRQNSRFAFDVQVYHLTLFFTMGHWCFVFNIAAWDATLEFHSETSEFWHSIFKFKIELHAWTVDLLKRIRWECWAQRVTQAWHSTHRSLHGSTCWMDSNATNAGSTLRRVAEQLLTLANEG